MENRSKTETETIILLGVNTDENIHLAYISFMKRAHPDSLYEKYVFPPFVHPGSVVTYGTEKYTVSTTPGYYKLPYSHTVTKPFYTEVPLTDFSVENVLKRLTQIKPCSRFARNGPKTRAVVQIPPTWTVGDTIEVDVVEEGAICTRTVTPAENKDCVKCILGVEFVIYGSSRLSHTL